jgi:GntR family transcriptional regulator/MocR family aminotransferase
LHLMITFTASFSDVDLASAAFERGVKVQPLSWHCQTPYRPGLVLGYAATSVSAIEQGVSVLAQAHRAVQQAGE